MPQTVEYEYTQRSPLSALLLVLALGMACVAWAKQDIPPVAWVLGPVSVLIALAAACVHQLTVTGGETALLVKFGPIPLFRTRIPYASMQSVEAARSRFIDGWGIHYIPGRGWTYNIWGFDCVLIHRAGKSPIRVGTDDVDNLLAFLQSKSRENAHAE